MCGNLSSRFWFVSGCLVWPVVALSLWLVCRGRARSPRPTTGSTMPSAPLPAHKLDSAKRAMSKVQLAPPRRCMDPEWLAGYDLLAGQATSGGKCPSSCVSSIANQKATRVSPTREALVPSDSSRSCQSGLTGQRAGTGSRGGCLLCGAAQARGRVFDTAHTWRGGIGVSK